MKFQTSASNQSDVQSTVVQPHPPTAVVMKLLLSVACLRGELVVLRKSSIDEIHDTGYSSGAWCYLKHGYRAWTRVVHVGNVS